MFGMFGGGFGGGTFEANYRCYPVSFIDKPQAEAGDKVFLPPSALDRLAALHIEYPMLFRIENRREGKATHCGVLEFIADEGMIYMPYWMMQNLLLTEGDIVNLKSATLPKGTFVKLQPHTKDFLDISNPKAVLETTLRNYSCLTVGDCICLHYNNKRYYIDIIDAKPGAAISVIETDCNVDFAPPLDYVEPNRDEQRAQVPEPMVEDQPGPAEEAPPEEPKFTAFTGSGRRLDGKGPPATSSSAAAPSAAAGASASAARSSQPPSRTSSSTSVASASNGAAATGAGGAAKKPVAGKVVFGGGNRLLSKQAAGPDQAKPPPAPKPEEKKEPEGPKFTAFQGRGNRLK